MVAPTSSATLKINIDIDIIKHRYERYHEVVEIIKCRDGFVLHIEKQKYTVTYKKTVN